MGKHYKVDLSMIVHNFYIGIVTTVQTENLVSLCDGVHSRNKIIKLKDQTNQNKIYYLTCNIYLV